MASHDLDIPQVTVVDTQDDTNSNPLDNPSFPTSSPPICDRTCHRKPLSPSPNTSSDKLLKSSGSPASRTFGTTLLYPPPPTQSAHSFLGTSAGSHDNDPEVHDSLSSSGFLAPLAGGYTLPVSIISNGTDHDVNGSASFELPSSVASFLKRIVRCVYYPSPSPSDDDRHGI